MTLLLDTHFFIWIVLGSKRLREFPWIGRCQPWGVSPVSLLEIQFLAESGRLTVENPEFTDVVMDDPRFTVDDPPLVSLVRHALRLGWTRDPFDRLLAAHSLSRRVPLCSADRLVRTHHRLLPAELTRSV
ncbi:MAG: PIN domain-containing protein [Candidatus Rokubacteria bacterium]|nr:PIN domain-containing protein [Candidatus Rokubacteria bacterium]